ncbi:fumarylacetoacetate hydrolase family protein [Paracrocinitomix mangrovi]|uniref:fumarylacetoacetate hydrolase family protein n=1 Tax=Paracrocinitomix mangrovi TaxID=2862509 RepID=UPI001C8DB19F|nr:fumarylacetoacetate hydrolase family protein [Paracrocinitomix mangrovi]UKN03068.1 fumarylacetoacetate hydrolase family protein [Paracrocinitomix mangrovi]
MKIICIGRNYAKHAKEMNAEVPSEPIFFIKPDTALLKENNFYYPEFTNDLHYEVELVLKVCKHGKHISKEHATNYYDQIGLGIDFTARDVQKIHKEKGLPWEKAKAFDNSAVLSQQFIDKANFGPEIEFSLLKNDEIVQEGNTQDLLFDFDELIAHISKYITLKQGDLIYTGTPEGVGPVDIGDVLVGKIEDREMFKLNIK